MYSYALCKSDAISECLLCDVNYTIHLFEVKSVCYLTFVFPTLWLILL
uniref:Uncharacterized protein n=1 Tax=Arundo donax TaxID=35708 RepID=A0A0A9A2K6_ARUDO